MEKENNEGNGKFLKGVFCGVAITLACLAASLLVCQWRLDARLKALSENVRETQETESPAAYTGLDLDEQAIGGKIAEIEGIINRNFRGDIDGAQVEDHIYSGMLDGLNDPYSEYYSPEALALLDEATSGTYSGIGVLLSQDPYSGVFTVVTCYENTPAAEAGMMPGDEICGVNGEDAAGLDLDELVSKIKTAPGDTVRLQLLRGGEELELDVGRRDIQIPTVQADMLDRGIGYLQILEFDEVTVEQTRDALEQLDAQGMEKLIVDVRDNPGGILQVVCDVLDMFLPEGRIVYMEDKYGERTEYFSDAEHCFTKPLAVLINGNSASAAEIFAGAIKDYGLGTLVGTTTFGKGIVQRIFDLPDGSGLKLTIAKYFTPDGTDIHEKGIEPDVEEPLDEALQNQMVIEREEDNQLQEAIRLLDGAPQR